MNAKQSARLDMLRKVQGFLDLYSDKLKAVQESGARQDLDELVHRLTAVGKKQSFHDVDGQSETVKLSVVKRNLENRHMRPVAAIAHSKLRAVPEISVLRMPRRHLSGNRLIQHAAGMAEAAAKYIGTFTKAGLPADFVQKLTDAAEALRTTIDARNQTRMRRENATMTVSESAAQSAALLKILDTMIKPLIEDDLGLLADWRAAKRVASTTRASIQPATPATPAEPGSIAA